MTTQEEKRQLALARLAEAQSELAEQAAAYHKAIQAAVKVGCTYSQMSATLGVSRQAIQQYVKRWLVDPRPRVGPESQRPLF